MFTTSLATMITTCYKLGKLYGETFPFTISKNLRTTDGRNKFYFTQGYEFEAIYMEPAYTGHVRRV